MSVLFLFGAGASTFNPFCTPHPPPLGAGLFDELLKMGGIANTIEEPLRAVFRGDPEEGTARFAAARPGDRHKLLREMAYYFTQFIPRPGNYYQRVVEIARDVGLVPPRDIVLSTTNYEVLIEGAVHEAGYSLAWWPPAKLDRDVTVLKIHGSCNLVPNLGRSVFRGATLGDSVAHYSGPVKFVSLPEARQFCEVEDSLAPAIALYTYDKAVLYAPDAIKEIQKHWTSAVEQADQIFVVGLRVNPRDGHIWDVLARVPGRLSYVAPERDRFEQWRSHVTRANASVVAETFEDFLGKLPALLTER